MIFCKPMEKLALQNLLLHLLLRPNIKAPSLYESTFISCLIFTLVDLGLHAFLLMSEFYL
jgi:hypothetical protein